MTQPTLPFDVKAIAGYVARNNTEVSLEVGKIYKVLQTDGRGLWWQTKSEDGLSVGWFPASYTEIVPTAAAAVAAPVPAPVPSSQPAAVAQTPVVQSTPVVSTPQPAVATTAAVTPTPNYSQPAITPMTSSQTDSRPIPLKTLQDKGTGPCIVTVHLVKAKDLAGAKLSPTAFVYKRDVMVDGKSVKAAIFTTAEKKKTNTPEWNEEFKLSIRDAETEVVCIRICNGKGNFKNKPIGEVEFPLRGAVRKFDKPNGQFQWFNLKGGKDGKESVGSILLFIEFVDTRVSEGPKNVKHEGHVGLSAGGGFEIRDIPSEWKQLFRVLNIKKKDLESNPEMAKDILNIMHDAAQAGNIPGVSTAAPAQTTISTSTAAEESFVPSPPPAPTPAASHAPAPPPPPAAKSPAPPPPPPSGGGPKPPPAPMAPSANAASAPGPAPPAPVSSGGGGGGGSIFDQIRQGGIKLKKAEIAEVEKGTASTGNPLADTLINAMSKYRADIAGNDKADDEDDWSE